MIGILSFGSGNVGAIASALTQIGALFTVCDRPAAMTDLDGYILPGVGHFGKVMGQLRTSGFRDAVETEVVGKGKPVLGICVGMQILATVGDEGEETAGLGWIPGRVSQMAVQLALPHMGWNSISTRQAGAHFLRDVDEATGFYFLHSFHFQCDQPANLLATVNYGQEVAALVGDPTRRIYGAQFHPEKSHRNGLQVFRNFLSELSC